MVYQQPLRDGNKSLEADVSEPAMVESRTRYPFLMLATAGVYAAIVALARFQGI